MSAFIALFASAQPTVPRLLVAKYRRMLTAGAEAVSEVGSGRFCVLTSAGVGSVAVVQTTRMLAVGDIRLDRDDDMCQPRAPWIGRSQADLDTVQSAIALRGEWAVRELNGDFAVVVWDAASDTVIAARDAFGIKALYYRRDSEVIIFASKPSLLWDGQHYRDEYIAAALAGSPPGKEVSAFEGVATVPTGGVVVGSRDNLVVKRHWTPTAFARDERLTGRDAATEFRRLFSVAVATRLSGRDDTWSCLSGGLDSTSVVCMAQALYEQGLVSKGLTGTITLVDTTAEGDETRYSDQAVIRYSLRNEQLRNFWLWQEDGELPPLTDYPAPFYPIYARERRQLALLQARGARILLNGHGSDHYLGGNREFFADEVAEGRWSAAAHGMLNWAIEARRSFWPIAGNDAVVPLLPATLARWVQRRPLLHPPWVLKRRVADWQAPVMRVPLNVMQSPRWTRFASGIAGTLEEFGTTSVDRGLVSEFIDFRYPFMYRPLVEFCLRLPPSEITRPKYNKWVLREAMDGILPEKIRLRTTKGGGNGQIIRAFEQEADRIRDLSTNPILGDLGWIEPRMLKKGIDAIHRGRTKDVMRVICTLSLETWLRVRAGRWVAREPGTAQSQAS